MQEIRVAWSIEGRTALMGHLIQAGLWHPGTPENRKELEIVVEAGNEAYGDGTHWVEVREA